MNNPKLSGLQLVHHRIFGDREILLTITDKKKAHIIIMTRGRGC